MEYRLTTIFLLGLLGSKYHVFQYSNKRFLCDRYFDISIVMFLSGVWFQFVAGRWPATNLPARWGVGRLRSAFSAACSAFAAVRRSPKSIAAPTAAAAKLSPPTLPPLSMARLFSSALGRNRQGFGI